ncbi:uncharacterized protein ttc6 [Chanos chanos]|uniref:Uncharacterized protein ttc6 n=1 Tax=Chanos chanos TaxID=29144 RepID=A0A6J2WGX3_CHACN|nr:tetratricopeptide repeat protein 6 [Chanos chanos]
MKKGRKSQRDNQQMKCVIGESSRHTTGPVYSPNPLLLTQLPAQVNTVTTFVDPNLPGGFETRAPPVSTEVSTVDSQDLLNPPLCSLQKNMLSQSISGETSQMSVSHSTKPNVSSEDGSTSTKVSAKHKAGRKASTRPVIAQLAGTVATVSLSARPQPPAKPRPERPSTAARPHKARLLSRQVSDAEKIPALSQVPQKPSPRDSRIVSSDSTDVTGESDSLYSEQSDRTALRNAKVKKGEPSKDHQLQSSSSSHDSKSDHSGKVTGSTQTLKSTTELLKEARSIAGVTSPGPRENEQQRVPEVLVAAAKNLVRKSRRTVDEIITSLQSGGGNQFSASDQIIKEVMKKMLGDASCMDDEVPSQKEPSVPQMLLRTAKEKRPSQFVPSCDYKMTYKFAPSSVSQTEPGSGSDDVTPLSARFKHCASEYKTIHHLCTLPASQVLPVELQLASRVCHTPSLFAAMMRVCQQRAAPSHIAEEADTERLVREGLSVVPDGESDEKKFVPDPSPRGSEILLDWQRIAEHYVEKPRMMVYGESATLCRNELRMFWKPAPPKFRCAPSFLKDKLFPKYQVERCILPATRHDPSSEHLLQHVDESIFGVLETERRISLENILFCKHKSLTDLCQEEQTPHASSGTGSNAPIKRSRSAPHLSLEPDTPLRLRSDFTAVTRELDAVRRSQQLTACAPSATGQAAQHVMMAGAKDPDRAPNHALVQQRRERGRGAVLGEQSVRRYSVYRPRRRVARTNKKLTAVKLAYIHKKLKEPPRTISRSESLSHLPGKPAASPQHASLLRRPSLPLLLDFESFAAERGGIPDDYPPREWVRDIWNIWFDEVFPPLEESSTKKKETTEADLQSESSESLPAKEEVQQLDWVDLSRTLDDGITAADLESEVARLTQLMAEEGKDSAFNLCRRGALYKKLGCLNQALEDLNAAISQEPHLLDAYWHRHSVYLLRNDPNCALDDLNFIIKHNKKHADAFKSRAEIYRLKGETTLAIINYTQAINCRPDDDSNYFKRAQMYEQRNENLLAMEDYAKTFAVNPARTDALLIHGLHYFNISNWMVALSDFSLVLQQEPRHSTARTYRGRVFAKLGQYRSAIEDYSLAVHVDPNNWQAFYYRGCLLRSRLPEMALRDFSTSVLINDTVENLSAFLHRGLLYTEQRNWHQAMSDFEAVIKLDRTVAVAHVSLGLIYMLKMDENYEAIKMFSSALRFNPTYIRAYICRARAYHNVHDLNRALKDLTRAIHMNPDVQNLYILRGQYLCEMEEFDLATFNIQYAAQINEALGSCPIQQAAVQSFLGNDSKAISCLMAVASSRPSPSILTLLGRMQMKACKFMEAVESFNKALKILNPNEANLVKVLEAAEVFYLMGMCYMAQGLLQQAVDAFNNAVKVNPSYADAYHQRGLCRMRLQQPKSIQDFKHALLINPNLFQVYLSRAAFYGASGRYSKAILNCNEAIQIQPKSVRAYLYRGALKYHLKMYKGAVEDLTTAIKIDNTCSFAYYNRAVCYQMLKNYELALRDYGIVLLLPSQKETDLRVLINRGLLYMELNDHHNALQDFEEAAVKCPEDSSIYHTLGVYHHRLGQLEEAVKAYSQAIRLNPFFLDAYVGRGNVFMDYGHAQATKQAQRDFLSALHLNPLCSSARISLAFNFQVFGRFQRAWNQFTVAVDINPECWEALEGRAVVSLQMSNTYAAFLDINNALKLSPLSDQLFTNRGVINQFMGDNVAAMRDYQKAISLNPSSALAFFNAANLFFYNRQFEQACEYYSRAVELDPSDDSAVLNRAITSALLRKVPEALRDFSEALRRNPYSSHVFFNRANLYCSIKEYEAAERDLTQALRLQPSDALVYKLRADVRGHLGLTHLAVEDYRTALELQEPAEH